MVIGPPAARPEIGADELDVLLRAALVSASVRDAAADVAAATGLAKRRVYSRALELAKDAP